MRLLPRYAAVLAVALAAPACKPSAPASPPPSAPPRAADTLRAAAADTTTARPATPSPPAPAASAPAASGTPPASPPLAAPPVGPASQQRRETVRFDTPTGWTMQQMPTQTPLFVVKPRGGGRTNMVVAQTLAQVRSLDDVELGTMAELARMQEMEGLEVVEKGRVTAAGQPAFRLHLRGTVQGQPLEIVSYSWRNAEGFPVQATLTVPTAEMPLAEARRSFEALVASLQMQ